MAHRWDTKDANGKPLTDGRICLVMESDEPGMAPIRVYGKSKDEVIDKLALTTETAQTTIHRLRKTPAQPPQTAAPATAAASGSAAATSRAITAEEKAQASADLNIPEKAPQAAVTLLKAAGVDVEALRQDQDVKRLSAVCAEWHRRNPDFPNDPRNARLLVDRAVLRFGHRNVTLQSLDACYVELQEQSMLFEPKAVEPAGEPAPSRGSEEPSAVRTATSYRRNQLRADAPLPSSEQESAKHQRWRKILETGTTRDTAEAMKEPGFKDWVQTQYAKTA